MPAECLAVQLQHSLGQVWLDVQFSLRAPWTVLFAPSGAGKTTVLRMIAGLERPAKGRIVRPDGLPESSPTVLTDTDRRIFVPAHRRGIRLVAQRPALFPHLSVVGNVQYRVEPKRQERDRFLEEIFALCRIAHLRDKMPAQLSGGEAQRVALARSLASGGDLLLLDEPFTGLEAELREKILGELRSYLISRAIPVLQVTHDVSEIFSAEAEVLRMEAGRIVAQGPAKVVLAQERQALLARLQR